MKKLLLLALLGCGSSTTDQPIDDAGRPIVDAAPTSLTNVPLDCVEYMREVRHTATDGSRDVTINSFATVELASSADFLITECDAPPVVTCSGSDTCTGASAPSAVQICTTSRSGGTFYDGKLTILCGSRTEHYGSNGTLTSSTQTTFTVKLEVP